MQPLPSYEGMQAKAAIGERRATQRGMTLVEVAIAITTLLLLTLAVLASLVPVSRQNEMSREMALANTNVQRILERVMTTPYSALTTVFPHDSTLAIADLESGAITFSYEDPAATPLIVHLILSWDNDYDGTVTHEFVTARAN